MIGFPFLPLITSISALVFGVEIVTRSALRSTEMGTFFTSSTLSTTYRVHIELDEDTEEAVDGLPVTSAAITVAAGTTTVARMVR